MIFSGLVTPTLISGNCYSDPDPAAVHTGQIRAELTQKGTPIGPYDQMIAGHARSMGLILVTNNTEEFERVDGIRIENWVSVS